MKLDQELLDRTIQVDYLIHRELLLNWVEAAEDLREEALRQRVLDLLIWARVEFRRRRTYLGLEESELERRAARLVRALGGGGETLQ